MRGPEALTILCDVLSEVGYHHKNKYASDCICGYNICFTSLADAVVEVPVLEFIRQAVAEKIVAEGGGLTSCWEKDINKA